jgi:hypothetical protein
MRMHEVQNFHYVLWIREHWKLDGIVGGGDIFAITYRIPNAVRVIGTQRRQTVSVDVMRRSAFRAAANLGGAT